MFATPKRNILAWNRVFWRILQQNPSSGLGYIKDRRTRTLKKQEKTSRVNTFGAQSHACAETKPRANRDELCTGVGVHDVITSANSYVCRLWSLSVVGGQILGFSVDLRHRP